MKKNSKKSSNNSQCTWAQTTSEVVKYFASDIDQGLVNTEVTERLQEHGKNRLRKTATASSWTILVNQFKSFIIGMLAAAAVISFVFVGQLEGVAILIAIIINTIIGFVTELRAVRSMESLQKISRVETKVLRDGEMDEIPAQDIVPGDIIMVEGGDIVTADSRILEASKLEVDESSLTGESVPVSKHSEKLDADTGLADRANMLFKGTAVTRGSGKGIVVHTGMETELGNISSLVEQAEQEEFTPLEKRLNTLGHRLIWLTIGVTILIALTGILAGKNLVMMIETAIALAVAAIPEGLPIVATVALARGMWRMLKRNALINRLSAVETLGTTSVILTDKTGTLTENHLTVQKICIDSGEVVVDVTDAEHGVARFTMNDEEVDPSENTGLAEIVKTGVLCNNATMDDEDEPIGDPLEVALLDLGEKAGMQKEALAQEMERKKEIAFDPKIKMMATIHKYEGTNYIAIKGAPEQVLEKSSHKMHDGKKKKLVRKEKKEWLKKNDHLAGEGLRILAFARKTTKKVNDEPFHDLEFIGLCGFLDPPRAEVPDAVQSCKGAGIRVVMVTGDQPATAQHIGHAVGITSEQNDRVKIGSDLKPVDKQSESEMQETTRMKLFARVTPEQKLDLIDAHQQTKAIVAMTGDGVNDAPALKKADIGIAMGKRGTQIAREAADMVLLDDAFNTIVSAIIQGRTIFANIRKFILFLLSGNVGEIMIVGFAVLLGAPLPILPLQILYLNMIGDVILALALGVGPENRQHLEEPPRQSDEPILSNKHWIAIGGYGLLIAASVLVSFSLALQWLDADKGLAVSISFLTLAFARLWHIFNMRSDRSSVFSNEVTQNPFVWGALVMCTGLLLVAVYVPVIARALDLVRPGPQEWSLILGMSLVPLVVGQIMKILPVFKGFLRSPLHRK